MVLKACIFDLDGVLVDTAKYHYLAWKRLAIDMGFDFTIEQNEQLKGISRMDSLDLVLKWGNAQRTPQEKLELATTKNDWYVEMINKMTPSEILCGVEELLTHLKENKIKIALGSASKNSSIILERTGIAHYFDAIVDGNSVSLSKPEPEVFERGAALLSVDPDNCVVFEDAEAGVEAARRAGMKVVGVGAEEILREADLIVPDLSGITIKKLEEL